MKIAFNARLLAEESLRGWNRYTVNLLANLIPLGVEAILYSDRPIHESHTAVLPSGGYRVVVSPPMSYILWEQRWLASQCRDDGAQLLHCPLNYGLPWRSPCPRVLTLHDALSVVYPAKGSFLQRYSPGLTVVRLSNWISVRYAQRIITVSQHAKSDIRARLGVPEEKLRVIYEAADERFHQPPSAGERRAVRERLGLSGRFIFYIGGFEERKNIPLLLNAFAAANVEGVQLVLAGGSAADQKVMENLASSLGIAARTSFLGQVPDAVLPAIYAEAECFVYPSVYEGFGLQLCEAMASGCAVLASNATSLPEVLGDGGQTFSPDNPKQLAELLRSVLTNHDNLEALRKRARTRGDFFSWAQTAQQTYDLYREILMTT